MTRTTFEPAQGDIVLVEVSGQYEFAHVVKRIDQIITVATLSGALVHGSLVDGVIETWNGPRYNLARAGTFVPGYARACEHFGY